jgi:hypothetical protein
MPPIRFSAAAALPAGYTAGFNANLAACCGTAPTARRRLQTGSMGLATVTRRSPEGLPGQCAAFRSADCDLAQRQDARRGRMVGRSLQARCRGVTAGTACGRYRGSRARQPPRPWGFRPKDASEAAAPRRRVPRLNFSRSRPSPRPLLSPRWCAPALEATPQAVRTIRPPPRPARCLPDVPPPVFPGFAPVWAARECATDPQTGSGYTARGAPGTGA